MQREARKLPVALVFIVPILLLTVSRMVAQDVKYEVMPGTDFSKYHTYDWIRIDGAWYPNQDVDAEIKVAVGKQLASKGLIDSADWQKPDLYMGYQIAVDKERQWNAFGVGSIGWGVKLGATASSTIESGSLVLDMYDPIMKQLVWTGRAAKTIEPSDSFREPDNPWDMRSTEETISKRLDEAIATLLKNFPPKTKK